MATLSVTFGKELSPQIIDIYWDALKPLAIEQFQYAARSCIRHAKHFPKPAEILERYRDSMQAAPKPSHELPTRDRKWLALVNAMFLQYLKKRRLDQVFRGDIDLPKRRAECLSLVIFAETFEVEFPEEATEAHIQAIFDKTMLRIPDVSTEEAWLPIELDRQRRQDGERDRAARP